MIKKRYEWNKRKFVDTVYNHELRLEELERTRTMEKFTNRVMIDLEDYMKLVNHNRDLQELNKESSKFIETFKAEIFSIGNKIIDQQGEWEVRKILEILDNEEDKIKNIDYYLRELNKYLETYIDSKTLRDLILDNLIKELKEQPHENNQIKPD